MSDMNEELGPDTKDAAASAGTDPAGGDANVAPARGRGRKLRTPFRRRRGDAQADAPAGDVDQPAGPTAEAGAVPEVEPPVSAKPTRRRKTAGTDAPAAGKKRGEPQGGKPRGRGARNVESPENEKEAEQALSYLDSAAPISQRLGKYLSSDALMSRLW